MSEEPAIEVLNVRNGTALLWKQLDPAIALSNEVTVRKGLIQLIEEALLELSGTVIPKMLQCLRLENFPGLAVELSESVVVGAVRLLLSRFLATRFLKTIEEGIVRVNLPGRSY
jgi:hypothetical protein